MWCLKFVITLLSSERANISIKIYQKVGTSYVVHYLKLKDSPRSVVLILKISVKQKNKGDRISKLLVTFLSTQSTRQSKYI